MGRRGVSEEDLQACDREPIHRLGRIQSSGVLLAVDPQRRIACASANAAGWLGREADALIGRPIDDFLPARSVDAALAHARIASRYDAPQFLYGVAWPGRETPVDVALHRSADRLVIEARAGGGSGLLDGVHLLADCADRMVDCTEIGTLASVVTDAVARITGYARVMAYRFAADGSGSVIAERIAPGLASYLGLRYPATDIPVQARALYLRNPVRVIEDVRDEGIALVGADPLPMDLSLATLRSVSPVHLEYLRNMGTAATMSVSIVVDGRLWGLIVCHHTRPLRPPLATRTLAVLLSRVLSLSIGRIERDALHDGIDRLLTVAPGVDVLFDPLASAHDHEAAYRALAGGLRLTGAALCVAGHVTTWGEAAGTDDVEALVERLARRDLHAAYAIESLAAEWPDMARLAPRVAALLALPISRSGQDWLLLFRDEVERHVTWAGDPSKPFDVTRGRLTPRASFETWRERVRQHGEPWELAEIDLADAMRVRLAELLQARRERRDLEQLRVAGQQQALLVRELNHRVRNILGLINGLVQQSAHGATTIDEMASTLQHRIGAMGRAHTQLEHAQWRHAPLATLLVDETRPFGEPGQVSLKGPPVDLPPDTYLSLALVIHELATNARKYGALSTPLGHLDVEWQVGADGALTLQWRERGGPAVRAPTRRGFGSRVIVEALAHEHRGRTQVEYAPEGLQATLWLPEGFVVGGSAPVSAAFDAAAASTGPLTVPASALIVEDDLVIALLAETMLARIGCRDVAAVSRVADALALLETRRFEVALLDVDLGDETSDAVARRLDAMRIPVILASGYASSEHLPLALRGHPTICKPYTDAEMHRALQQAMRSD